MVFNQERGVAHFMYVETLIDFLKRIEAFKTCERACRTTKPDRAESDAEHSWHLALFLMLLANRLPQADPLKLLKIALIHDLPEIYAGDTNPYIDDTGDKEHLERRAAARLFADLPADIRPEMNTLIEEYLDQKSIEARLVKSVDKLMPLIQNICTTGSYSSYRRIKVPFGRVEEYMEPFFRGEDVIRELYEYLLKDARLKGVFFDDDGGSD
jgi:putative hydrolase of HD superfamily